MESLTVLSQRINSCKDLGFSKHWFRELIGEPAHREQLTVRKGSRLAGCDEYYSNGLRKVFDVELFTRSCVLNARPAIKTVHNSDKILSFQ